MVFIFINSFSHRSLFIYVVMATVDRNTVRSIELYQIILSMNHNPVML